MQMAEAPAIGIDLGTSYSCVAVFQHGNVEIIQNDQGNRKTPSCVAFTATEIFSGGAAKYLGDTNPKNTIFDAKRLIGRRNGDPTVEAGMTHWPFTVISDGEKPKIQVEYKGEKKTFFPEEISSMVLTKMKETAEAYLGMPVTNAVITVPANFNDSQRQATIDAGTIAGLNVLGIINEPTAAAIAYGLYKKGHGKRNILIFDLGGGTFDVSVLTIKDGTFEVKATAGDTQLGGEDFDNIMVNHFVEEFKNQHKKDLTSSKIAVRKLRNACEKAKRALSFANETTIEIDPLYEGSSFCLPVTRDTFERLNMVLFLSTKQAVEKCLRDAKMEKTDIHDIVLVGGSTRIPMVQNLLKDFFDGKELNNSINPDEAVAFGAAVQAASLSRFPKMAKAPAIGIDLGTTYSCVAVFQHGKLEIIADGQGNSKIPSCEAFTDSGILIEEAAKNEVAMNPNNTIVDMCLSVHRFENPSVQAFKKHLPFNVTSGVEKPMTQVPYSGETKTCFPEDFASMVLIQMKEKAEALLGKYITNAVITVPGHFNDSQRQATKDSCAIAGLNVLEIINKPNAAAIAYGLENKGHGKKNILIFDLGGRTFDVSILTIKDGIFDVKATVKNSHLGGKNFDDNMFNYLVQNSAPHINTYFTTNMHANTKLRTACERAKWTLSSLTRAEITIDNIAHDTITREKFVELNLKLFHRTMDAVKICIQNAKMKTVDIHDIVLVGGSTRIPKLQEMLQGIFKGKKLNMSINPHKAVAYGAAVQAAILTGYEFDEVDDLHLLDVTPLSLGIKTTGGVMDILIKRNTTIPTKHTKMLTTHCDDQLRVKMPVYEGERAMAKNNNILGMFVLTGIPVTKTGFAQIEVAFDIDFNGILKVTAVENSTGKENIIIVTNDDGRRSQGDIERMVNDAEIYRSVDEKEKQRKSALNDLESYCYRMMSEVKDAKLKGKISETDQNTILDKCNEFIIWLVANQIAKKDEFDSQLDKLKYVCNAIMTENSDCRLSA